MQRLPARLLALPPGLTRGAAPHPLTLSLTPGVGAEEHVGTPDLIVVAGFSPDKRHPVRHETRVAGVGASLAVAPGFGVLLVPLFADDLAGMEKRKKQHVDLFTPTTYTQHTHKNKTSEARRGTCEQTARGSSRRQRERETESTEGGVSERSTYPYT